LTDGSTLSAQSIYTQVHPTFKKNYCNSKPHQHRQRLAQQIWANDIDDVRAEQDTTSQQ